MSEIFIPMPNINDLKLYLEQKFDGFFIGLENFSSNFNYALKIDELDEYLDIINKSNKKSFICFNRLMYNDELDGLKEVINILKTKDITGVCFTDIGTLELLRELEFDKEILWFSNHLGTNSNTIKFLNKRDVNYFLLSTEITKDEIINIKNNCPNQKIGCMLYGFLNMATSSRKLLSNYFAYIDKEKNKDKYIIKDQVKNNDYILVENKNTNFFTGSVLNGIKFYPELIKNNIDFIYLDDYMLDSKNFYNVIEAFSSLRNAPENEKFINTLEEVVNHNTSYDCYYGFLDKKTVFKVEDYE